MSAKATCGPCKRGEHEKCYGTPPATAVMCDCRDAGHQRLVAVASTDRCTERMGYDRGYRDELAGIGWYSNPYPENTVEFRRWVDGKVQAIIDEREKHED